MSRLIIKPTKWLCTQRRLRTAWASAQSDQSSLCAQWVAKDRSFLHEDNEDWSDWADAQAELILRWAHRHYVGFVMSQLKYPVGARVTDCSPPPAQTGRTNKQETAKSSNTGRCAGQLKSLISPKWGARKTTIKQRVTKPYDTIT